MSTASTPAPSGFGAPDVSGRARTGPILVATTGDDGTAALETADRLAARDGRAVAVVSAVELPPAATGLDGVPLVPDVSAYMDAQQRRVIRQLDAVSDAARAWPVDVVVDEPSRAIVDAALARDASLLVLGTGRHDLPARLLGEVALRVVRRAPCAVLTVPRAPLNVPAEVAVAAIDFSASSVVAARAALDLLAPGGTLHLVHAWLQHALATPGHVAADEGYERDLPARFARVERELLDRARDVTILPTALRGDTREQLLAFAASHGADLIAAGRQGHTLYELLVVGRVTTALLREAHCAVLVTPQPTLAERDTLQRSITGTSESRTPTEFGELLDAFSRRNTGRRTRLEIDDPALGAQTEESGWTLLGATFDHHDRRVSLMLGDPAKATTHLTHAIERVASVAVHAGADGRDDALRLAHGTGQTLLTFLS